MAYTTPSTWASGTIVTATFLNEQVQGNMEFLGTSHRHSSGTAGEGGGSLGPISYVDFNIAAAPAAPAATAMRLYASGTELKGIIGATATIAFSDTGHEHAIATNAIVANNPESTRVGGVRSTEYYNRQMVVDTQTSTISTALTVGGTGARGLAISAGAYMSNVANGSGTGTLRLFRESTALASATIVDIFPEGGTGTGHPPQAIMLNHFVASATAGSVTYNVTFEVGGGTIVNNNIGLYAPHLAIFEIKEA